MPRKPFQELLKMDDFGFDEVLLPHFILRQFADKFSPPCGTLGKKWQKSSEKNNVPNRQIIQRLTIKSLAVTRIMTHLPLPMV